MKTAREKFYQTRYLALKLNTWARRAFDCARSYDYRGASFESFEVAQKYYRLEERYRRWANRLASKLPYGWRYLD